MLFILGHLPCKFSILILTYLHWECAGVLAYFCIFLALLHTFALAYTLGCFFTLYTGIRIDVYVFKCQCGSVSVQVYVWKCQCVSVSVEVSVFKGFSGRTLRNAFGNNFDLDFDFAPACPKPAHSGRRRGEKGRKTYL